MMVSAADFPQHKRNTPKDLQASAISAKRPADFFSRSACGQIQA
jgi:hypothetical protein